MTIKIDDPTSRMLRASPIMYLGEEGQALYLLISYIQSETVTKIGSMARLVGQ